VLAGGHSAAKLFDQMVVFLCPIEWALKRCFAMTLR